jgi:protein SCO1/2|tara:strand:- start:6689 stop:6808 length:120 start_codon:yes stop_codon:yes gene_type:complete
MSHSSQLFLFGPDGAYVTAYAYGTPAEDILADLNERLES